MTVNPGLVLKVINGLEGVDGRNASVSKAEEEIPEVGKMQDGKMARCKMTRGWQDGKSLARWQKVVKIFNLCDFCQDEAKILS